MHRVLAVTCDRWPDAFALDREEPSADVSPLAEIAAESTQFHAHSIQDTHAELLDTQFGIVLEIDLQSPPETIGKVIGDLRQQRFIQIDVGPKSDAADLAELLSRTIREVHRFIREKEKSEDRWLAMVTAGSMGIAEGSGSPGDPTDSSDTTGGWQLSPVPLWLRFPNCEVGHSAAVTGSSDLTITVEDWISRNDDNSEEAVLAQTAGTYNASPISLVRLLENPHLAERRRLLIRTDTHTAARDSEFLLVRSYDDTSTSEDVHLFRKPDDVHNLLDVADQCPDIVEEMTAWLHAHHEGSVPKQPQAEK